MSRKRPAPDYTGRHRVMRTASNQHRQDRLPPPDTMPLGAPVSQLISDEPSRWYDRSRLHSIDPDLIAPVREPEPPPNRQLAELPPWMEPKQKIKPRYIIAFVATALVAAPALFMAGWIANENASFSTTNISHQFPSGRARVPVTLVVNGHAQPVCITLAGSGPRWTARASASEC